MLQYYAFQKKRNLANCMNLLLTADVLFANINLIKVYFRNRKFDNGMISEIVPLFVSNKLSNDFLFSE